MESKRLSLSVAVRNFESRWFLIPQGTGIIAVLLHQQRYQFNGLKIIADIFWVVNIATLIIFLLLYALRAMVFPGETRRALTTQSTEIACLACIPISFTSIIQMMAFTLPRVWGRGWEMAAYVLWWINVAMAIIACVGMPYVFAKYVPPGVNRLSPAVNLPIIAALTAAAGGGTLCRYGGLGVHDQIPTIIVSYLLIGAALPLALGFSILFMARLFNNESPTGADIFQDMILCGPWGQGSFALQILGSDVMRSSFAEYNREIFLTAAAAKPVGYSSIFIGLVCWGHATFWWAFAVISIVHSGFDKKARWRKMDYLQAWSLVFPWGVYTNACNELGVLLTSRAFSVWTAVLTIALVSVWLINVGLTLKSIVKCVLGPDESGSQRGAE